VIGARKFTYDVWGDAVNLASRLEGAGEPGHIHVSGAIRDTLANAFDFTCRGDVLLKGVGIQRTWYLLGAIDAGSPSPDLQCGVREAPHARPI